MAATALPTYAIPTNSPITGGVQIVVTGTGFDTATGVKMLLPGESGAGTQGDVAYHVDSPTQLTIPSSRAVAAPTVGTIQVRSAGGGAGLSFGWVILPTIQSVSPQAGAPGTVVTLVGNGYSSLSSLTMGGTKLAYNPLSDSQLTFVVPRGLTGPQVSIVATNSSGSASAGFNYFPALVPTPSVPEGRGRWRLTLHARQFAPQTWEATMIAEITAARGRALTQAWNAPAELTFSLDEDASNVAGLVLELATDVIAWRYDEYRGQDIAMFRGIVDHSEDQVTTENAVVTFTCHDYLAMLERRILTSNNNGTQLDQDYWVDTWIDPLSLYVTSSSGQQFRPGAWLPLQSAHVNPDGSTRNQLSGQLRDRNYLGNTTILQLIDDMAKVIGGYDYDLLPGAQGGQLWDLVRVFYPQQGTTRTDMALQYGTNVSAITRTVASSDYANYVRVIGNNQSEDPNAAQVYAEAWNSDSNDVTVNPVGLWMTPDAASDVIDPNTLTEKAQGDLNLDGLLMPSYTVTLTPGTYRWGFPKMGDTVTLVVKKGRLNLNTQLRVLGISYAIGDDGDETVGLTLGRAASSLASVFKKSDRNISALARR